MNFKKFITILMGIIGSALFGIVITKITENNTALAWMGASCTFGFDTISIDLSIMRISFGMSVDISAIQFILFLLFLGVLYLSSKAKKK